MKTKIFSLLLLSIMLISCNSEKADFEKAEAENSIPAYEAFLEKYPRGEYREVTAQRLEKLAYQFAREKDSVQYYREFKAKYPGSPYLDSLKTRLQELEFFHALEKDDLQAYRTFIKEYPGSEYESSIEEKIEYLSNAREVLPGYSEVVATYPNNVKLTMTHANIEGDKHGNIYARGVSAGRGFIEIRNGEMLVFHYGTRLTALNKLTYRGRVFLLGDKITVDKNLNPVKVKSWE